MREAEEKAYPLARVSVNESNELATRPEPRVDMTTRPAAAADVPFLDELQKMHSHMVGWFPKKQMESHIGEGNIIIAEDEARTPFGYCIAKDQYMSRDDVGVIFQLNVLPIEQRKLIGATLVRAVFDRAAYGCRLFCCWCAQDIQANFFWESIGFVPLAFRTGSRGKQRIHIFWQRRVREGDETTPYWFPSQTRAGAVREDRIVLPIPPGTHWRDAKPLLVPGMERGEPVIGAKPEPKALPPTRPPAPKVSTARKMAVVRSKSKHLKGLPPGKAAVMSGGGLRYIERGDHEPEAEPVKKKPRKPRAPRKKHDPKLIAQARELRDRYLEDLNEFDPAAALPPGSFGKWDVSKELGDARRAAESCRLPNMRET
ncbi:MAG: hypothetical protein ACF8PN_02670 [Phycisphaerales bacterium]